MKIAIRSTYHIFFHRSKDWADPVLMDFKLFSNFFFFYYLFCCIVNTVSTNVETANFTLYVIREVHYFSLIVIIQ